MTTNRTKKTLKRLHDVQKNYNTHYRQSAASAGARRELTTMASRSSRTLSQTLRKQMAYHTATGALADAGQRQRDSEKRLQGTTTGNDCIFTAVVTKPTGIATEGNKDMYSAVGDRKMLRDRSKRPSSGCAQANLAKPRTPQRRRRRGAAPERPDKSRRHRNPKVGRSQPVVTHGTPRARARRHPTRQHPGVTPELPHTRPLFR